MQYKLEDNSMNLVFNQQKIEKTFYRHDEAKNLVKLK